MSKIKQEVIELTQTIQSSLDALYNKIEAELSRPDKSLEFESDDLYFKSEIPENETEEGIFESRRDIFITELLEDAQYFRDWSKVIALVSGEDPADHQFEIIKEEIIPNLDADGKPITAKPLNEDSVYVEWQDENKFKFEESV